MSQQQYNEEQRRILEEEARFQQKKADNIINKIKEGDVHMKTNSDISVAMEKGDAALASLQNQDLSGKNKQIITDVRQVIEDDKRLLNEKNDGDLIQNLIRHAWALVQGVNKDTAMGGIFQNLQEVMASLVTSADLSDLLNVGGHLAGSLYDTQIFLQASLQLINIMKLILAQKTTQITGASGRDDLPSNVDLLKSQRNSEKEKLFSELRSALHTLSSNPIWQEMVMKGKTIAERAKQRGKEAANTADDSLTSFVDNENVQLLIDDIASLLQRLVGNQMDIDPLFKYAAAALMDISDNSNLTGLVYEAQEKLQKLITRSEKDIMESSDVHDEISDLTGKAEKVSEEIKNNPNVIAFRDEVDKLKIAIRKEPLNAKLLDDTLRLWHDMRIENKDTNEWTMDKTALKGLRQMIIPILFSQLSNIPLPSISDTGDMFGKYAFAMENIHISIPELIPENIHLKFEYDLDANVFDLSSSHHRTYAYLEAKEIQVHVRDVKWTYQRFTMPKLVDSGTVNFGTYGKGITLKMKMELKGNPKEESVKNMIEVLDAHCYLDRFHVTFTESKHNKIYGALSHLFQRRIKREIQLTLEKKLKGFGSLFNDQLLSLFADAKIRSHEVTHKASVAKQQAREKAIKAKENAKQWRTEHSPSSSSLYNKDLADELKEDAKYRSKGAIVLASERVSQILDQQQERVQQKLSEKQQQHNNTSPRMTTPNSTSSVEPVSVEMQERIEMKEMSSPPSSSSSSSAPSSSSNVVHEPLLHPSFVAHGDSIYNPPSNTNTNANISLEKKTDTSSTPSSTSTPSSSSIVHEPLLHPSFVAHGDSIYQSNNNATTTPSSNNTVSLEKKVDDNSTQQKVAFGAPADTLASLSYSVHPSVPSFNNESEVSLKENL